MLVLRQPWFFTSYEQAQTEATLIEMMQDLHDKGHIYELRRVIQLVHLLPDNGYQKAFHFASTITNITADMTVFEAFYSGFAQKFPFRADRYLACFDVFMKAMAKTAMEDLKRDTKYEEHMLSATLQGNVAFVNLLHSLVKMLDLEARPTLNLMDYRQHYAQFFLATREFAEKKSFELTFPKDLDWHQLEEYNVAPFNN